MDEKQKRDGGVGDVWNGLLGDGYKDRFPDLINQTVQSKNASVEKYEVFVTFVDSTQGLPVQVILKNADDKLLLQSITVKFPSAFDNIDFVANSIEEWSSGAEGTFEGTIFDGHSFSFFCQNYLAYKGVDLIGKKIDINISVIARKAEIFPVEKRSFTIDRGPFKGEPFVLDNMRYLNPVGNKDPELCQFFFPIQEIQTIKFFGDEVYKIKGVLSDTDSDKDYFYNVFINKSLVSDPANLKVGEPLNGWGWLQAEIKGVLPHSNTD